MGSGGNAGSQAGMSPQEVDTDQTMRRLGAEIRRIRGIRGLTLQDVGARTGLSVSMLSMLERGVAGASVGTLVAVSSAIGVPLAELFHAVPEPRSPVRRRDDQVKVEASPGVLRRTVHYDPTNGVEVVVLELSGGTDTGAEAIRHAGHEYLLLLNGQLVIELRDARYTLEPGDAMRIESGDLHRFINETTSDTSILLVRQPGT